jgi:hypothetical protein
MNVTSHHQNRGSQKNMVRERLDFHNKFFSQNTVFFLLFYTFLFQFHFFKKNKKHKINN